MTARTFVDPFDPRGQVLTPWPYDPNSTERFVEDEDTLRRSFGGGLSDAARTEQRRPKPFVVDELGYTSTGAWSPDAGKAA